MRSGGARAGRRTTAGSDVATIAVSLPSSASSGVAASRPAEVRQPGLDVLRFAPVSRWGLTIGS
jgi:hypothetical protein